MAETRAQKAKPSSGKATSASAKSKKRSRAPENGDPKPATKRGRKTKAAASTGDGENGADAEAAEIDHELEDAEAAKRTYDPMTTTMSALTRDAPIGRALSTRLDTIRGHQESQEKSREYSARRKALIKAGKKGSDVYDPDEHGPAALEAAAAAAAQARAKAAEENDEDEDDISNLRESDTAPQLRVASNGSIELDELALTVDLVASVPEANYQLVVEDEKRKFVNTGTHSKKIRGLRWGGEETANFYHYLAMYGTDFESISRLMPNRTRDEVKNKFNAEDKKNCALVTATLMKKVPINLEEHSRLTGVDLSGPPPEIRAPERPVMGATEDDANTENTGRKSSRTPRPADKNNSGEEIIGSLSDDDGEDSPSRAPFAFNERESASPPPLDELIRGSQPGSR
ncbi:hypothetical protein BOTBODRAFT_27156 [Botryobasidium botryosum FD-172 SS1]|uniref:Myb-like domain-containing protein n=1 Tax=Botryobasidium botryosum (strain FD-172 SS1) TaxID=930990 RepID=A0A067N6H5_BOTB1|nr:hypothetical protein BOTBODRAFT_27156 [Botryobasidium botryosum FD-172 SS1]